MEDGGASTQLPPPLPVKVQTLLRDCQRRQTPCPTVPLVVPLSVVALSAPRLGTEVSCHEACWEDGEPPTAAAFEGSRKGQQQQKDLSRF